MQAKRFDGVRLPMIAAAIFLAAFSLCSLGGCSSESSATPHSIVSWPAETAASGNVSGPNTSQAQVTNAEPDPDGVQLLGVSLAAEGTLITVNFRGPLKVVQNWWQGSMYVVDEANGLVYSEIPVTPVIGPLLAKPKEEGQAGYVMLTNTNSGVKQGSVVSVVLGNFKRVHVVVQ